MEQMLLDTARIVLKLKSRPDKQHRYDNHILQQIVVHLSRYDNTSILQLKGILM